MTDLSLFAAFVAGLASFLSPCVCPLVPGYLSLISGNSLSAEGERRAGWRVAGSSLVFVAGFSLVFVTLGVTASSLGTAITAHRDTLNRLAGVFMIVMGLFIVGALQVPWLYRERRFHPEPRHSLTRSETLLLGMAFGFGWTPCIGPLLGSILVYTSAAANVSRGTLLLTSYSIGLGVPFIVVGVGLGRALGAIRWISRHYQVISIPSGATMMAVGLLFLTGRFFYFSISAQRLVEQLGQVL
ncbi:MAG TPA: cytochrome c biogenesis protein CcdA [Nitrolancea sp.]|nr:cytochrome c biogenesis protein CcdA [Nitrolancea sp.]